MRSTSAPSVAESMVFHDLRSQPTMPRGMVLHDRRASSATPVGAASLDGNRVAATMADLPSAAHEALRGAIETARRVPSINRACRHHDHDAGGACGGDDRAFSQPLSRPTTRQPLQVHGSCAAGIARGQRLNLRSCKVQGREGQAADAPTVVVPPLTGPDRR